MIGQKPMMASAVILAVLMAFLLIGISNYLFPSKPPVPGPDPEEDLRLDQILMVILWIGLAAFIAFIVVAAILLVNRIRHKKNQRTVRVAACASTALPKRANTNFADNSECIYYERGKSFGEYGYPFLRTCGGLLQKNPTTF